MSSICFNKIKQTFIIHLLIIYFFVYFRYGSDLVSVESFRQNNFTAELASEFLTGQEDSSYWLGLQAYNELQTNTLSADDGHQVGSVINEIRLRLVSWL